MESGLHHWHVRKRIYEGLEEYPGTTVAKYVLDRVMYVVALIGPLAFLPQVIDIFSNRNAEGLSLITWPLLVLIHLLWLSYGLLHRATPVVIAHSTAIVLNTTIIIGILLYG